MARNGNHSKRQPRNSNKVHVFVNAQALSVCVIQTQTQMLSSHVIIDRHLQNVCATPTDDRPFLLLFYINFCQVAGPVEGEVEVRLRAQFQNVCLSVCLSVPLSDCLLIKTQTQMSVRKKFNYGTRVVTGGRLAVGLAAKRHLAGADGAGWGRKLNKLAGKCASQRREAQTSRALPTK